MGASGQSPTMVRGHVFVLNSLHRRSVMPPRSLVSVVDDDESVRESLPDLLRKFGFAVQAFSPAEEFLASDAIGKTNCLILDIAMPGMTGYDLQTELARRRREIPIVFITAHGDESLRPTCLKGVPSGAC
jgi:FixJ family two-component response regulator